MARKKPKVAQDSNSPASQAAAPPADGPDSAAPAGAETPAAPPAAPAPVEPETPAPPAADAGAATPPADPVEPEAPAAPAASGPYANDPTARKVAAAIRAQVYGRLPNGKRGLVKASAGHIIDLKVSGKSFSAVTCDGRKHHGFI